MTEENGRHVLYLQLVKLLYGCVRCAILWLKLFSNTLKGMNHVLNPYDPYVANAIIRGTQCTITWYVDDNKILHIDQLVVDKTIKAIEGVFGGTWQGR